MLIYYLMGEQPCITFFKLWCIFISLLCILDAVQSQGCQDRPSPQCCPGVDNSCTPIGYGCKCDSACQQFGDCCFDYFTVCLHSTTTHKAGSTSTYTYQAVHTTDSTQSTVTTTRQISATSTSHVINTSLSVLTAGSTQSTAVTSATTSSSIFTISTGDKTSNVASKNQSTAATSAPAATTSSSFFKSDKSGTTAKVANTSQSTTAAAVTRNRATTSSSSESSASPNSVTTAEQSSSTSSKATRTITPTTTVSSPQNSTQYRTTAPNLTTASQNTGRTTEASTTANLGTIFLQNSSVLPVTLTTVSAKLESSGVPVLSISSANATSSIAQALNLSMATSARFTTTTTSTGGSALTMAVTTPALSASQSTNAFTAASQTTATPKMSATSSPYLYNSSTSDRTSNTATRSQSAAITVTSSNAAASSSTLSSPSLNATAAAGLSLSTSTRGPGCSSGPSPLCCEGDNNDCKPLNAICFCDAFCLNFNDCCQDYISTCKRATTTMTTTTTASSPQNSTQYHTTVPNLTTASQNTATTMTTTTTTTSSPQNSTQYRTTVPNLTTASQNTASSNGCLNSPCSPNATCTRTDITRGYSCSCNTGFTGNGTVCTDINECLASPCPTGTVCFNTQGSFYCSSPTTAAPDDTCGNLCSANATCTTSNSTGAYFCQCKQGFIGDGQVCVDINECNNTTSPCRPGMTCVNTIGSYICTSTTPSPTTASYNGCLNSPCSPNATCTATNLQGSYNCSCNPGFTGNGTVCTDINECLASTCPTGTVCLNTQGSFYCASPTTTGQNDGCSNACSVNATCTKNNSTQSSICVCKPGFTGNGTVCDDINECAYTKCSANATCINTPGSYACVCAEGYTRNGELCIDINECNSTTSPCRPGMTCINTVGSYICSSTTPSPTTASHNGCLNSPCSPNATCTATDLRGSYNCSCNSGFSGNGTVCADINECLASPCPTGTVCFNTQGSFYCSSVTTTAQINGCRNTCSLNATCTQNNTTGISSCVCKQGFTGNGTTCTDINECAYTNCSPNATCINTPGSYTCICAAGFTGDGQVCVDINECNNTSPCRPGMTCVNTVGSYICTATTPSPTTASYNGCLNLPCSPNATCTATDLQGGYNCSCNSGFTGNGTVCTDVNECLASPCPTGTVCFNTQGSFYCSSPSVTAQTDGCTNACSANATCTKNNSTGTSSCVCKQGFTGNGTTCIDINECAYTSCSSNATCINTPGSYSCVCAAGFTGDGQICVDINECSNTTSPCRPGMTCVNTVGSYMCSSTTPSPTTAPSLGCSQGNKPLCCNVRSDSCKPANSSCFCDSSCLMFSDCCSDYKNNCLNATYNGCLNSPCSPNATCTATDLRGSYYCSCNPGFTGNGTICSDINECLASPCPTGTVCFNTQGSFYCSSPSVTAQTDGCTNACSVNATCTKNNSTGSSNCVCKQGFTGNGTICTDINECAYTNCSSNATCINTPGSYTCVCAAGFTGDGQVCVDINECNNTTSTCRPGMTCVNTIGSYICTSTTPSPTTASYNGCLNSPCSPNATCTATDLRGSYNCSCNPGFTGNGTVCADINECLASPCPTGTVCFNTQGSFYCSSPSVTAQTDGCTNVCSVNATCTQNNTTESSSCVCKQGFTGNGTTCTDINECAHTNCSANATCINTPGSYTCVCAVGFTGNGQVCADINECNNTTSPCRPGMTCVNTVGSYICSSTTPSPTTGPNPGCSLDNKPLCCNVRSDSCKPASSSCFCDSSCLTFSDCCSDYKNNCLNASYNGCLKSPCSPNATCTASDLRGNYNCSCNPGFAGNGTVCTDINECLASPCPTGTVCFNTQGSFYCSSPSVTAQTDGCTNTCSVNATCTKNNTTGSSSCVCKQGFTGNGTICNDINECAYANCSSNATCINTPGSYTCACAVGFTGDGQVCVDINECNNTTSPCRPGMMCVNTVGSYICSSTTPSPTTGPSTSCSQGNKPLCCNKRSDSCKPANSSCFCDSSCLTFSDCCSDYKNNCLNASYNGCLNSPCSPNATCTATNLRGSYNCSCNLGFTGNGTVCADVNECLASPCPTGTVCFNTQGSFYCSSPSVTAQTDGCTNACSMNATCTKNNTTGSSSCVCKLGFTGNGTICNDINECAYTNCSTNATCINTPGSYTCVCVAGFTGDGQVCVDVNECNNTTSPCRPGMTCVNTVGSYMCSSTTPSPTTGPSPGCSQGNKPLCCNVRSDSCKPANSSCFCDSSCLTFSDCCSDYKNNCLNASYNGCLNSPCSPNATCTATDLRGNYNCSCQPGFTGNGTVCADINECLASPCPTGTVCFNTQGSFYCSSPSVTAQTDGCTDACSVNATCTKNNTTGSSSCVCKQGFTGNGTICNDINECAYTNCSTNATCINTPGSYTCVCAAGFTGDGQVCADINECNNTTSPCRPGMTCVNTVGSYICSSTTPSPTTAPNPGCSQENKPLCCNVRSDSCKPANSSCFCDSSCLMFSDCCSDYKNNCLNASYNGCLNHPCSPNATCTATDLQGNYSCACSTGFTGNGTVCTDINECLASPCPTGTVCFNTQGSFYCSSPTTTAQSNGCTHCSSNATCTKNNTSGAYICTCKEGFTGNGQVCTDINECLLFPCQASTACVNTAGSYFCSLPTNTVPSGRCPSTCPTNAVCTRNDTSGEYYCACKPGYGGISCTPLLDCSQYSCPDGYCIGGGGACRPDPANNCALTCYCPFDNNSCVTQGQNFNPNPLPDIPLRTVQLKLKLRNGNLSYVSDPNSTEYKTLQNYTDQQLKSLFKAFDPNTFASNSNITLRGENGEVYAYVESQFYYWNNRTVIEGLNNDLRARIIHAIETEAQQSYVESRQALVVFEAPPQEVVDKLILYPDELKKYFDCSQSGYSGYAITYGQQGFNCTAACTDDYCYNGGTCEISNTGVVCRCKPFSIYATSGARCENIAMNLNAFFGILFGALAFLLLMMLLLFLIIFCCCCRNKQSVPIEAAHGQNIYSQTRYNYAANNRTARIGSIASIIKWRTHYKHSGPSAPVLHE
ncbi:fibrillin-2-like [Protopterus annectens]|uniref:fibrillin-2-like n=1 Tax=Protopterus annectens TaxID=7888 RepID=UPI001CFA8C0B|nr:fibrillin-2-like [Protopterus annectens]